MNVCRVFFSGSIFKILKDLAAVRRGSIHLLGDLAVCRASWTLGLKKSGFELGRKKGKSRAGRIELLANSEFDGKSLFFWPASEVFSLHHYRYLPLFYPLSFPIKISCLERFLRPISIQFPLSGERPTFGEPLPWEPRQVASGTVIVITRADRLGSSWNNNHPTLDRSSQEAAVFWRKAFQIHYSRQLSPPGPYSDANTHHPYSPTSSICTNRNRALSIAERIIVKVTFTPFEPAQ
jgi:hypothetical protein